MTTIAPSANEVPVGGMYAMYCIVSIENGVDDTFVVVCCTCTSVCVDIVDRQLTVSDGIEYENEC